MIEVMTQSDILKINLPQVQNYLVTRFKELEYPLQPSTEGYFIYVEDFTSLQVRQHLTYVTLPSISEGLFRHIEAITIKDDIIEVSLLFNNEFLLSVIFYKLDDHSLDVITKQTRQKQFFCPKDTIFSTCPQGLSNLVMSLGIVLLRCMVKR